MLVRSIYAAISLLAMMGCSVAVTIPKLDKTDPEIVVKQDALKKVKTIAIIAFQDSGKSELKKPVDHDGNYIAEAITFELAKTFRFKMIDRNAIETIMKERQITASTLSSRDIKELGEVLGAEVIMTGQINQCGTAETWKRNRNGYVSATIAFVNFDFKLMDTQSSEVLAFGKVRLNSQQRPSKL